jgi:hypothetical protein
MRPLNLFYEEPDNDRWLPHDRYPRRVARRFLRTKPQPGGVARWFLNLRAGLDRLGVEYRVNDYRFLRRNSGAWANIVGKPHVIDKLPAGHPIIYGPGVGSHPSENDFWGRADIRLLLISCEWFRAMYDRELPYSIRTVVWPAGIDTELWAPQAIEYKTTDFLLYDKVRWKHAQFETTLLQPIRVELKKRGLSFEEIRYGFYKEENYRRLLERCRAMIFLCEHETQGFAYLQALSAGTPILAWDRGGFLQDPALFPNQVRFEPVTSVPYFDERCGLTFESANNFEPALEEFLDDAGQGVFSPREYILENLTLEKCARNYLEIYRSVAEK